MDMCVSPLRVLLCVTFILYMYRCYFFPINQDDATFAKLRQSLLDLQEEVARLGSVTKSLIEENNAKQKHIEVSISELP